MTIEEEFFKVFEIEPKWKDKRVKNSKTYYTKEQADYLRTTTKNRNIQLCYPEITDRKLLEMICIITQSKALLPIFISENIENLKDEIIQMTINAETKFKHNNKIDFKHQIQQLFKEEE